LKTAALLTRALGLVMPSLFFAFADPIFAGGSDHLALGEDKVKDHPLVNCVATLRRQLPNGLTVLPQADRR
jgi:hypothetical protein